MGKHSSDDSLESNAVMNLNVKHKNESLQYWDELERRVLDAHFAEEEPNDDAIKWQEENIIKLGRRYNQLGKGKEMRTLIAKVRTVLQYMSKAKAAKLVRELVDLFLEMEEDDVRKIGLCRECVEWATEEKRSFLRRSLQTRLIGLYLASEKFSDGLALVDGLLVELKRLDDKDALLEVQCLESQIYFELGNLVKAKTALTAARTTANAVYVLPHTQAELDVQSGMICANDGDFKTAFSYFYEAHDQADEGSSLSVKALKYMMLSKVMAHDPEAAEKLVKNDRLADARDIRGLRDVARANADRSLADFKKALKKYDQDHDRFAARHLDDLMESLVEENLVRIVEPYSRVQVTQVAKKINLPADLVERKLSKLILDKKIDGVLDQESRVLIVFDRRQDESPFDSVLEMMSSASKIVDKLYGKAKDLS